MIDGQLFEALSLAVKAHAGQERRANNTPYVIHPLAVARILSDLGCGENVIIAGLLHDTVEDTDVTLDEIRELFGEEVAFLVEASSEPNRDDQWETRKRHTIEYLRTAPEDVLLLVCADKLDNVRSLLSDYAHLGEDLWSRFHRPREKQHWYYATLAELFLSRSSGSRVQRLFREYRTAVEAVFGPLPGPEMN